MRHSRAAWAGPGVLYLRPLRPRIAYWPTGTNNPTLTSYDLKTGAILRQTVPRQVMPSLGPRLNPAGWCVWPRCDSPLVVKPDGSMAYIVVGNGNGNVSEVVAEVDRTGARQLDSVAVGTAASALHGLTVVGNTVQWQSNGNVKSAPFF